MELDVYTTTVELLDIPSYTTNITLEGQLLRLHFLWNERIGKRTLFITNTNEESYLQNTTLHPNEPFELNSNAVYDELPYSVVLQKVGNVNRIGNILNWSKDYVLCFYRTVDAPPAKLNVLYGVTVPSTPILPKPFGPWILNEGFEIVEDNIKYTAYKTNDIDTYDSFALSSLQNALVKSFLDSDLQQYAAFTTAVEQLTGTVDWVLDPENKQIRYFENNPLCADGSCQWLWSTEINSRNHKNAQEACNFRDEAFNKSSSLYKNQTTTATPNSINHSIIVNGQTVTGIKGFDCVGTRVRISTGATENISHRVNPYASNPDYAPEEEAKTIPLETVAQKVISNAEPSPDEILKMLSEDYITLVANSIFDSNPAKQFVKLSDLISQLEANKVLR